MKKASVDCGKLSSSSKDINCFNKVGSALLVVCHLNTKFPQLVSGGGIMKDLLPCLRTILEESNPILGRRKNGQARPSL